MEWLGEKKQVIFYETKKEGIPGYESFKSHSLIRRIFIVDNRGYGVEFKK